MESASQHHAPGSSPPPPPKPIQRRSRWNPATVVSIGIAIAVALYVANKPDRDEQPLVDVFSHLDAQGYVANPSLAGHLRPGDVLQLRESNPADPAGPGRQLRTPLVALRVEECFAGLEPHEAAFPLPETQGSQEASLGLEGARLAEVFPGLAISDSAVRSYRLTFDRPRLRGFAKLDLSGDLARPCAEKLQRALATGERLEWFETVVEVVEAQGLNLEVNWQSGLESDLRAAIQKQAEEALVSKDSDAATALQVQVTAQDKRATVIRADLPVVLGYRSRPMQRVLAEEAAESASATPDPRDVFLRQDAEDLVGRLALRVQQPDGSWSQVPANHAFRTGDRFRFEVEASRTTTLFVFHRAPEEELSELWPAQSGQANTLEPRTPTLVPAAPAAFEMQGETGDETFFIALAEPAALPPRQLQAEPLVNFVLRGLSQPDTRSVGITYDADPWLYFQPSEDAAYLASVAFQLRHVSAGRE